MPIEFGVGGLGTSQDMILVTALALHSGTTVMPLFTFVLYVTRNQKFDTDAVKMISPTGQTYLVIDQHVG